MLCWWVDSNSGFSLPRQRLVDLCCDQRHYGKRLTPRARCPGFVIVEVVAIPDRAVVQSHTESSPPPPSDAQLNTTGGNGKGVIKRDWLTSPRWFHISGMSHRSPQFYLRRAVLMSVCPAAFCPRVPQSPAAAGRPRAPGEGPFCAFHRWWDYVSVCLHNLNRAILSFTFALFSI